MTEQVDSTDSVLTGLIDVMRKANPQQKLAMARALGVTPTHRAQKRDRNQEALQLMRSQGPVTHARGFEPKVPEGVAVLDERFGGAATEMWLAGWHEGKYHSIDEIIMALEQGIGVVSTSTPDPESLVELLK